LMCILKAEDLDELWLPIWKGRWSVDYDHWQQLGKTEKMNLSGKQLKVYIFGQPNTCSDTSKISRDCVPIRTMFQF
jgi:hypothetical protein